MTEITENIVEDFSDPLPRHICLKISTKHSNKKSVASHLVTIVVMTHSKE